MSNRAGGDERSHDRAVEARVAVLEAIAAVIKQGMVELRQDVRGTNRRVEAVQAALERDFRAIQAAQERDLRAMQAAQERDFRLLFGAVMTVAIGLAGLMDHGFRWF
jgi:hypothetical protein